MKNYNLLKNYKKNIYSQNGEDGIVEEILKRLNIHHQSTDSQKRWCVEFGAWDGKMYSNTFALVERKNWQAIYIEGDLEKFIDLKKTSLAHPNIIPICAFVSYEKESKFSLDNILQKYNIPKDFDILSIDIDSYDLDIWQSFTNYYPKIVIIEINSAFLPGFLFYHNPPNISGNSFSSTLKVAEKKGYTLISHTGNMIFIKSCLFEKLKLDKKIIDYPELLFDNRWIPKRKSSKIKALLNKIWKKQL